LIFSPNPFPLARRWIAWTQDPNPGLPLPNRPPTIQIQSPSHVVHENGATVARFRFLALNTPLARRWIARTQNPGPKPRLTPPQSTPLYPNPKPLARRSRKRSHCGPFSVFSPKHPTPLDRTDPGPKPRLTPPQSIPLYPNPKPLARRSRKRSHCGPFSVFNPKHPHLVRHWIARTQDPNPGLPVSN
jgi:hypothetical protein